MLIIGDMSGIQDFLFDVRESGGKQAVALRFRSFRLQVIAECLARKFLWTCGLDDQRLVFCAAGKFCIDASSVASIQKLIEQAECDIQHWLMHQTHGRLRFAVAVSSADASVVAQYGDAMRALQASKLHAWMPGDPASQTWSRIPLVTDLPWNADAEADRDADQGRRLLNAQTLTLTPAAGNADDAIAGVATSWKPRREVSANGREAVIDLKRLSRHIPRDDHGHIVEFVDLAAESRGTPMLGVLKADADSLGLVVRQQLQGSSDLKPLGDLSSKLETFFGTTLDQSMSTDPRWSKLYTVFSGGDDLLLVGPWDIALDFAIHVREAFTKAFSAEKLTLSAGMALVKPRFPIRLAAQQAEYLLEKAKSETAPRASTSKDQFAALGGVWKWSEHVRIIDAGRQLADWVEGDIIQRGWLHTLLELALLQRNEGRARSEHLIPAMASSRLAYHVARNWPKSGPARQWAHTLLQHFDRFPDTTDPVVTHLPSILRYAMLATRSSSDME